MRLALVSVLTTIKFLLEIECVVDAKGLIIDEVLEAAEIYKD